MAVPQFRYPLDKTGENPNNFVSGERHSLNPQSSITNVRVLAPYYGPFFSESLRMTDMSNGRVLVKDTDYKITDLLQDPTLLFAKPIGQFIVVINGTVSNEVTISYQVLGGNYQNDATAVTHVYETFLNDTRPVDWDNISGKPTTYPPSLHIHMLEDVIGFGPVIVALEQLKEAILLSNTPMVQSLIDWVNTRKTPWENMVNVPDFALASRVVGTPTNGGLTGGGNLTKDLSLSLQKLFAKEGTFGSAGESLQLGIDVFGRVNKVITLPSTVNWDNLLERPTTVGGFGITDAVKTHSDQSIDGIKTFLRPIVGSLKGNADTATVLKTARKIGIKGAVTGTPTAFDGSKDIDIPVTDLNASNLSTGIVPPARMEGVYEDITLRLNDGNSVIKEVSPGNSNTSARLVYGLAAYRGASAATSGAIVFTAPDNSFAVMHQLEVSLMTYTPPRAGKIVVNGYRSSPTTFSNTSVVQLGSANVQVRWAINPQGKTCLILGDTGTSWSYPNAVIAEALISHSGSNEDYCKDWTSTLTADLSGYTAITNCPVLPVDTSITGNAATANEAMKVLWNNVQQTPTTIGGYGITDAVTTSGDQIINGKKTFTNVQTGKGSLAANIHNAGFSQIVSQDFLNWFMANNFSSAPVNGVSVIRLGSLVIQYGVGTNTVWYLPRGNVYLTTLPVPLRYMTGLSLYPLTDMGNGSVLPVQQAYSPYWGTTAVPQTPGSAPINYIMNGHYVKKWDGGDDPGPGYVDYNLSGITGFWVVFGSAW